MDKGILKNKLKKIPFFTISIIIVLLVSVLFLWIGMRHSIQANLPTIAKLSFTGEYKIADGEWKPILKDEHISSTKGDVTLRGHFQALDPITNEPLYPIGENSLILLYFNHIRATVHLSTGEKIILDTENELYGKDACAVTYTPFYTPKNDADNPLTIVLHNPHLFGNENAIDDFLSNMSLNPDINSERMIIERGSFSRNVGLAIIISSLIILGIAAFSFIIHIKNSKEIWMIGLMCLFAGGYFLFGSFAVSLWNPSHIINTRALGLCMMLYMLFLKTLLTFPLQNKAKRISIVLVSLSIATTLACILTSLFTDVRFFDTWLYWAAVETAIVSVMIVLQIISFKSASAMQRISYAAGSVTLIAFIIDVIATAIGWWEGGMLSKLFFLAIFIVAIIIVLRIIPSHINTAIKAKQLESEQQALKLELEESRISIMLSQMQPHFIFNTLNTIYHLCNINPDAARSTISSFSEYLRNNIDNLGQSELIPFEKEFSFVKTYLDIEKVRFDDELDIHFDIEAKNFKLPVLTIQPIVENAVKHGTSKKEGGAKLTLSTRETDSSYLIIVSDTGVGFDSTAHSDDGHKHIGITNVRDRLKNLCGGTLSIESKVGVGTTATVTIPKKGGDK